MLDRVTFTGWDRHTDIGELQTFLEDMPQQRVEIAVLFSTSRSRDNEDRYPDPGFAEDILRVAKASGQHTALHLCGQAARALLESAIASELALPWSAVPLVHLADRVQVNVGEEFWPDNGDRYRQAWIVSKAIGRSVIVQSRSIGCWPDVEHLGPGANRMVPFLFDRSAGTGAAPPDWPFPRANLLVGYAGGLGPDNVAGLCESIARARIDGARWWLDMETRIRSSFDIVDRQPDDPLPGTRVSIDKCRQVMRAVGPWLEGR
jgi:hypothetical protein